MKGEPMKLDANNAVPLYEQLKITLQAQLETQVYAPGERLPAEAELCNKYGVSRVTVRRALDDLVSDGILERKQGKGTFVAQAKFRSRMRPLNSMGGGFTDTEYPGDTVKHTRVISKKEYKCNAMEQKALNLSPEDKIQVFQRLMIVDGEPLSIDRSTYPAARFPGLFDQVRDDVSTYRILREQFGIKRMTASKELGLAYATEEQAGLLNCPVGAPLFRMFKRVKDENGKPVHLSNLYFVAERIVFTYDDDDN